jgi:hypothetical protein
MKTPKLCRATRRDRVSGNYASFEPSGAAPDELCICQLASAQLAKFATEA